MDFQKSFDTVPHKRLLLKLQGYGITENLLKWIENYLADRTQKVVLNGCESKLTPDLSGIPQGSVLGPILFAIYINDLPDTITSTVKLFADDTKIYSCINTPEECCKIQEDFNRLEDWSKAWLLKFNKSKCKHVQFGKPIPSEYYMENVITKKRIRRKGLGYYYR